MAYLGKGLSNYENQIALRTDVFSGDGTTNNFVLSYAAARPQDLEVVVNNVQQSPFNGSYSINGANIAFATPPTAVSNNVYIIYRDYFQVAPLVNNQSVIEDYIASQAVTTNKLGNHAVTSVKMANTLSLNTVTLTGPAVASNTVTINSRATAANHATQKQYVDALTIVFGA